MGILDRIEHWAVVCPARPAHISGERSLTYGELWERSGQLAVALRRTLLPDGLPIVVRGHKEPEMLVAFLAAVRAGHPYIPVDQAIPEERVERILAASGAVAVLTAVDLPEPAPQHEVPDAAWQVTADDALYIIYTSGSTGEPKGVQVTRSCLESFLQWMEGEHTLSQAGEVFLNQAPFSFDLSVMDLYLSLVTGGTLFSLDKATMEHPRQLFAALAGSGVTTWVSTPSFALICLAERSFSAAMLPQLTRFLFCGETLPNDCAAQLLQRFPSAAVWNTYGPTEATVATTSVQVDAELLGRHNPLPVGRPKPGTDVIVVDPDGNELPPGERGEIVIIGPNVALGYLHNPAQTERSFFTTDGQRGYRTGDWGRYRNGLLFWEGRMDFQVKIHGYRIELGDVEAHLRTVPGVEDAVVLPFIRNGRPESLAAFIVSSDRYEGADFARAQTLRHALADRLPAYMVPRKFMYLTSFPLTANGKADRRRLAELLV